MKSIGTVLLATLLMGGCSHVGMLGFELEITTDDVSLRPVTEQTHLDCSPESTSENWC